MFWIIGIIVFIVFLWAMKENPEDIRAREKYRHEVIREEITFVKSERERNRKEMARRLPSLKI